MDRLQCAMAAAALVLATGEGLAVTIHVPGDEPTIQGVC